MQKKEAGPSSQCPPAEEWAHRLRCSPRPDHHPAADRDEVLTDATPQASPENRVEGCPGSHPTFEPSRAGRLGWGRVKCPGAVLEGRREMLFRGALLLFGMESSGNSGDHCTTLQMHLMSPNSTLKWLKWTVLSYGYSTTIKIL